MKRVLLILCFIYISVYGKSQTFDSTYDYLGKTSQDIISFKNGLIDMRLLNNQLREVSPEIGGGFSLHYTYDIDTIQSSEIFSFNKYKRCTYITLIQNLENRDEQIEYFLKNGFYRKKPFLYYHEKLNLQVLVEFDKKFVSFTYTHKKDTQTN